MNKVILCGHLGSKPELRHTNSGKAVANFTIATNDGKDKPPTWHRVTCWEKTAELAAKYLDKGRQVLIEGRLQVSQYEKDGEKRTSVEVVATNIQFLGGGKGERTTAPASGGGDDFGPPPGDGTDDIPF